MDLYGDLPPAADDGKEATKASGWARPNAHLVPKRHHSTSSTAPTIITANLESKSIEKSNANKSSTITPSSAKQIKMTFKPRQAAVTIPVSTGPPGISPQVEISSKSTSQDNSPSLSSPVAIDAMATLDVEDPYDPSHPNDYLEYCELRLEKKRRARIELENKKTIEESERKRAAVDKERAEAAQRGDVERLKEMQIQTQLAQGGRGRGRGLSNLPAWMTSSGEREKERERELSRVFTKRRRPRPYVS
mmetsp:Transcript_29996/g.30446  ORF Transcript_29996/g.30446 Transcript_29996/m.30446 type:complete len:248 (+) Transcript_29996:136-879(+)